VKIATFAKPETVMGKLNKHSGSRQADHLSDKQKCGDKKTTIKNREYSENP